MIVFITGGVMSSLGKGITASTLGALLRARGQSVRLCKFDPYLNVDPGTMNPYQHGEVFVTDDGAEVDLDFGSYERFTDVNAQRSDSTSTGKIYLEVIEKERRGDYLGQTIQVIPHITDEIKRAIINCTKGADITICEIGGTVGDIEGLPFLEAIRQLRHEHGADKTLFLHLAWVPYFEASGELKTKPLQHSVKELQRCGIQPDILVCRCDRSLPQEVKKKIGLFCNMDLSKVIEAQNVKSIYDTPVAYNKAGLDIEVCKHFNLSTSDSDLTPWQKIHEAFSEQSDSVTIGIVGKYTQFPDTYRSIIEALHHGGLANRIQVEVQFISAEDVEKSNSYDLTHLHGILIPGGFGARGIEGKIKAISFARSKNVPFFGICFGLQLAVIEAVRNLSGFSEASSSEFGETNIPVIATLMEWVSEDKKHLYNRDMGGTMRLGSYPCTLLRNSKIYDIYSKDCINERHRHRYEVNGQYISKIEEAGIVISGMYQGLVECIERNDHPWFIATQFHPEFKSRPFSPHPLFSAFVKAALCFKHPLA